MRLGEYQKLTIIKKVEFGVYLAESRESEEKVLLRNTIITIAHKIYLKKCLALLCEERQDDPESAKKKL